MFFLLFSYAMNIDYYHFRKELPNDTQVAVSWQMNSNKKLFILNPFFICKFLILMKGLKRIDRMWQQQSPNDCLHCIDQFGRSLCNRKFPNCMHFKRIFLIFLILQIKKRCFVDFGIPNQVIVHKTIIPKDRNRGTSGLLSVATKVFSVYAYLFLDEL